MPTQTTGHNGRLCNQIIRNLCVSHIAKKHDLLVLYSSSDRIQALGIPLYSGKKDHGMTKYLTDANFFQILNTTSLDSNLNANESFFQTKEIMLYLYKYLWEAPVQMSIKAANPFRNRYDANKDCFIHIRLTAARQHNPGLQYYLKALSGLSFHTLYIATDDPSNTLIQEIQKFYTNVSIVNLDEVKTIQFGSTCKNIILSHGSYSAMIGYLAFHSTVYYKGYAETPEWCGDMFSDKGWIAI